MSEANLRRGPSTDYVRAGILLRGERGRILEVRGDWFRIDMIPDQVFWIRNDLVDVVQ